MNAWKPLERSPDVLTLEEVADAIRLNAKSAQERRRQVRQLIIDGHLRAINPNISPRRWTVSRWEVARYIGAPAADNNQSSERARQAPSFGVLR